MGTYEKLLITILRGTSDTNVSFRQLCDFLKRLGFEERISGSHHIFYRKDFPEIINIQPKGSKAKPYQVKQIRMIILKYQLGG